jgi:N-acetylneuraminic acid mutarotase
VASRDLRKRRGRRCAARWRLLILEQFEPRRLLTPLTNYDQYYTPVNTPLVVSAPGVLANDNGFGLPLTAVKDADPTHGTLTFRPDGSFTYTPAADYNGHDTFTYHANDGQHDSYSDTVYISMSLLVAPDRSWSIYQNNPLSLSAAGGLLANVNDPDGDTLSVFVVTQPTHGKLTVNSYDGSFTYQAYSDFSGADSFVYVLHDSSGPNWIKPDTKPQGKVTINVLPAENFPVGATKGQAFSAKVAHFVPINAALTAADFNAKIDWGDQQTSVGTVTASAGGGFDVMGSHTYATSGYFPMAVTITDPAGKKLQLGGQWIQAGPMAGGDYGFPVLTGKDGRIYAFHSYRPEAYDPTTGVWTLLAPMPTQRTQFAAVVGADGRIYTFGGWSYGQSKVFDIVEIYDPTSDTWTVGAHMPTARSDLTATRGSDGRIYVMGGRGAGAAPTVSTVDVYDPSTNVWGSAAPMSVARANLAAITIPDGRILIFGGYNGDTYEIRNVEAYDVSTNRWSYVTTMPTPQQFGSAVLALGRIIVYSDVYDPATNTWSKLPPRTSGVRGMAAADFDGRIYSLGATLAGDPTSAVQILAGYAAVGGPVLRAASKSFEATEGLGFSGTVENFTDDGQLADYAATINWGDGSSSAGQIAATNGGGFEVRGSHVFATAGSYSFNVLVQRGGTSAVAVGIATIHHQPRAAGVEVRSTEGSAFSGTVATLTDDAGDLAAGFTAVIDWGDGSAATAGTVLSDGGGKFHVTGSHLYVYSGMYAVRVTVTDSRGNSTTTNGAWSAMPPMPRARVDFSAVTGIDGRIYVVGGTDYSTYPYQPITAVDVYDTTTGAWVPAGNLPGPIISAAATAGRDGHIYVIGYDGALAYDPTTNVWTTLPANPSPRHGASLVAGVDGRIYVIGGYTYPNGYSVPTGSVMAYDPVAKSWSSAASLPFTSYFLSAATGPDNRIYVLGGDYTCKICVSTWAIAYTPGAPSWTTIANLNNPRLELAAASGPSGLLYALGGGGSGGHEDLLPVVDAEAYDPVKKQWLNIAPMSSPHSYFAAAMGGDGRLYALGGYGSPVRFEYPNAVTNVDAYSLGAAVTSAPSSVNHAPVFYKGPDETVANNDGPQTIPGWAAGIVPGPIYEANQKLTFISTTDSPAIFLTMPTIDAKGTLSFLPLPGATGTAVVTVVLNDDGGTADGGMDTSLSQTFNISIGPAHNHPPSGSDKTVTMLEDETFTFSAADFGFTDPNDTPSDALAAVIITTLPPVSKGMLSLAGSPIAVGTAVSASQINSGQLRYRSESNGFSLSYAKFTFQLRDSGGTANGGVDTEAAIGGIGPHTITIDVTPVNDAPVGTDVTITAAENGTYTFVAADFPITDFPDAPLYNSLAAIIIQSTPLKGSLKNNGVDVNVGSTVTFNDINTGKLVYTPILNQSGSPYANFTFRVRDNGGTANGGEDTAFNRNTVTINVELVSQAPVGTSQSVTTLEDTTYIVKAADFGFVDPNDTTQNSFISVEVTAAPVGGTLRVNNGPTITTGFIKVSDIYANLLRFIPFANLNGTAAGKINFKVKDDGGTANGGKDEDVSAKTLTFNITSVNDEPQGAEKTINPGSAGNLLLEDGTYQFVAADFGFTDPNDTPANFLAAIKITSLPAAGSLSLGSSSVALNQSIPVASLNLLTFKPAPNANGLNYASFRFQVQDDGGTANGGRDTDSTDNLITLNVTSVNDPPRISLGPAPQLAIVKSLAFPTFVASTHTFTASDFGVTDPDDYPNANQILCVTFTSGLSAAVGTLLFQGTPVANGTVILVASLSQLVYTAPTTTGSTSFTFTVQDDGPVNNYSTAATFNISVGQPVNSAPAGSDLTVSTLEDTEYLLKESDFGYSDPDSPPNAFQAVSFSELNLNGGTLQLNGVNVGVNQSIPVSDIRIGRLRYRPSFDLAGNAFANVKFQVQDNGDTSQGGINTDPTPNTLTFNVVAVNDAPAGTPFSITLDEDTAYTFAISSFGFTDSNDIGPNRGPASTLSNVKITTIPLNGQLLYGINTFVTTGDIISAANIPTLRFIPVPNANGNNYGNFTFQVQDGGSTAIGGQNLDPSPRLATINVTSVNDAPQSFGGTVAISEGTPGYTIQPGDFGFSDPNDFPSNNPLTLHINAVSLNGGVLSNNTTPITGAATVLFSNITGGKLVYTPASPAANGTATIAFKITDDGDLLGTGAADTDPATHTLTISILPHNSPPQGADKTVTLNEDSSYSISAADFGFNDSLDTPNLNSFAAVKIVGLSTAGSLFVGNIPVAGNQFISVASLNTLRFIPAPNANGNAYASFTFQVQDDGGSTDGGIDLDPSPNTLTFNVTPVNDPPVTVSKTIIIPEDTQYGFSTAEFAFSDPNDSVPNGGPINEFKEVILQAPSSGSILLNSIFQNTFPLTVSVAQINAGILRFVPPINVNNINSSTPVLVFQVRDTGQAFGTADTSNACSLTFSITPINDSPIGTSNTIGTLEDRSYTINEADFGFSDPADQPVNLDSPNPSFASVIIAIPPANGSLKNGTQTPTAGSEVPISAIRGGQLVFTPNLNENGIGYGNFSFKVRDTGSNVAPNVNLDFTARLMTVNVTPMNDPPSGTSKTITAFEDTAYTITQSDLGFTDFNDNPPNSLFHVVIPGAPRGGTLFDSTGAVTVFPHTIAGSDFSPIPNTGSVRFVPISNLNSPSSVFNFNFQVKDNGGTANGGSDLDFVQKTITFIVTPVNDSPVSQNFSRTISENQQAVSSSAPGYVFTANDFRDPSLAIFDPGDNILGGGPANTLAGIHITSIPTSGTLFNGSTAITNTTTVVPVSAINAGQLKYVPNQYSNSSLLDAPSFGITFKVQDNGSTANGGRDEDFANRTASFSVTAINTEPAGSDKSVTTNEDTGLTLVPSDFGFREVNDNPTTPNQQLAAVIIVSLPVASAGTLSVGGIPLTVADLPRVVSVTAGAFAQSVTFQPTPNVNGPALTSFGFQVQDDGSIASGGIDVDQSPNTITINVSPVNDPPSFVVGVDQSATDEMGPQSVVHWAAAISFGPPNEASQKLHFVIQTNTHASLFAAGPNVTEAGTLAFTPAPNVSGTADITIVVIDDAGGADTSSPQTFHITITKPHRLFNAAETGSRRGLDVTGWITTAPDGFITPGDALGVINYINAHGSGLIPAIGPFGPPYCDTDGDGFVIPSDALRIINYLNTNPGQSEGEGEYSAAGQLAANSLPNDLISLLAFDLAEQATGGRRRR